MENQIHGRCFFLWSGHFSTGKLFTFSINELISKLTSITPNQYFIDDKSRLIELNGIHFMIKKMGEGILKPAQYKTRLIFHNI